MQQEKLHQLIQQALAEDIGEGDHSTLSTIEPSAMGKAVLKIKEGGILAGMEVAQAIFSMVEPSSELELIMQDGDTMNPGNHAFTVKAQFTPFSNAKGWC